MQDIRQRSLLTKNKFLNREHGLLGTWAPGGVKAQARRIQVCNALRALLWNPAKHTDESPDRLWDKINEADKRLI
jgi:hypothetical protein